MFAGDTPSACPLALATGPSWRSSRLACLAPRTSGPRGRYTRQQAGPPGAAGAARLSRTIRPGQKTAVCAVWALGRRDGALRPMRCGPVFETSRPLSCRRRARRAAAQHVGVCRTVAWAPRPHLHHRSTLEARLFGSAIARATRHGTAFWLCFAAPCCWALYAAALCGAQ